MSEYMRRPSLDDLPLFSGPPQIHRHPDITEVEAAERVADHVSEWRRQVYRAVADSPNGLAGFELCEMYPLRTESSCRTRLTELKDMGLLKKAGTRVNRRGNNEMVWVAV